MFLFFLTVFLLLFSKSLTQRETVGKVDGKHKEIQSIMSFAQDSESTGYKRINYSTGINHVFSNGTRLALEYQRPLYNNVNQVQLDTEYSLILGLQHSF